MVLTKIDLNPKSVNQIIRASQVNWLNNWLLKWLTKKLKIGYDGVSPKRRETVGLKEIKICEPKRINF